MNVTELQLVCPKDQTLLDGDGQHLRCVLCGTDFPVVNGIPVLIDDATSVFSVAAYLGKHSYNATSYGASSDKARGLRGFYRRRMMKLQNHVVSIAAFTVRQAVEKMLADSSGLLLVIGAGNSNYGTDRIVYSDVAFSPKATLICDGQAIPFPDDYFDGVIIISVLEHVPDPWRCAQEIKRVTKVEGFVYASTPFLQPVHMGAHDFTRFTYLGHRRLFNSYDEIASGTELGPANSVTFAMQHVLLCLSDKPLPRKLLRLLGILLGEVIKPIDYLFRSKAGAYDAAAAVFFFGRKSDRTLTDKEIIKLYRGAQ